jgi:hypothetical protein
VRRGERSLACMIALINLNGLSESLLSNSESSDTEEKKIMLE